MFDSVSPTSVAMTWEDSNSVGIEYLGGGVWYCPLIGNSADGMIRSSTFLWGLLASLLGLSGLALAGGLPDDTPRDAEFLDRLVEEREAMCLEGVEPIDAFWRRTCAVRLSVSREDLNKDGAYELIVFISQSYSCGASSCDLDVYEKRDGDWVYLTGGENNLETFEDPKSEWPILIFFGYSGRIWKETEDQGEYVWFCVSDLCRWEQGG